MQTTGSLTTSGEGIGVLTYEVKNTRPVDLLDFTASLSALGEEFQKFVHDHGGADFSEDNVRLYVQELTSGSIVAKLISLAQQYNLLSPDNAWVVQFVDYLSGCYNFFKAGGDDGESPKLEKAECDRLVQIVEPAAKDGGGQLNIVASEGSTVNVHLTINSTEANAIQNRIRRHRDAQPVQLKLTGIQHDQVLYWYQVRDDTAAKPGDRAVIPRIHERPVKVQFASDTIKSEMIDRPENPFRLYYIVDVDVTVIKDRPVLYRVLAVKDTMEKEDPDDTNRLSFGGATGFSTIRSS